MKQTLVLLLCLLLPLACLAEGAELPLVQTGAFPMEGDKAPVTEANTVGMEGDEVPVLSAVGQSEIVQIAQQYTVSFETTVYQDSMDGAREAMAARVQDLCALVDALAVADLTFTRASIRALKEYSYTKLSQNVSCGGYAASCEVHVCVPAGALDALLSSLHEGGIAPSFEILPCLGAAQEARDQALCAAAQEAMRSASVLAQAMGRELDTLISVSHVEEGSSVTVRATYRLKE